MCTWEANNYFQVVKKDAERFFLKKKLDNVLKFDKKKISFISELLPEVIYLSFFNYTAIQIPPQCAHVNWGGGFFVQIF